MVDDALVGAPDVFEFLRFINRAVDLNLQLLFNQDWTHNLCYVPHNSFRASLLLVTVKGKLRLQQLLTHDRRVESLEKHLRTRKNIWCEFLYLGKQGMIILNVIDTIVRKSHTALNGSWDNYFFRAFYLRHQITTLLCYVVFESLMA